ncbi:IclR family transcriptional regulator [Natronospirillum operosum]|uniref:HTH-type transcriptional repressor AllR n=1 Tax=Natronospirillum operosum TaxID=2759953 RepID=A0A4Z0WDZ7_9GAMM|nr:IclR family transcriptional regulator [Natronospirillum operosum]TGG94868.1 IclR family transcriptional regulator [Natronospirillum operosum]
MNERDLATPSNLSPPKTRQRQTGLDRSLQILDALVDSQRPMTAYQIAATVGAPNSTIYRTVEEMLQRGMLSRSENKEVWLGPRLMRYGLLYQSKLDFFTEARREMERLSEKTSETVQICGRDEGMMVVMAMCESNGHFRVTSHVGTRVPLNWTASGKLLLGHYPESEARKLFAEYARPSPTGRAETDPEKLAQQSCAAFKQGYSIQRSDSEFSVACIAAPIRNAKGECNATISIVLPDTQVEQKGSHLIKVVQAAAREIEARIGY